MGTTTEHDCWWFDQETKFKDGSKMSCLDLENKPKACRKDGGVKSSREDCKTLCEDTLNCMGFTFVHGGYNSDSSDDVCYLTSNKESKESSSGSEGWYTKCPYT